MLFANEMRTAFDEFTYLARRLPSGRSVAFQVSGLLSLAAECCDCDYHRLIAQEIAVEEPQLELFRNSTGRVASPPLRMCVMRFLDAR